MNLGFTGTQKGMTPSQIEQVTKIIDEYKEEELTVHHGDCIGADEQMHWITRVFRSDATVHLHPPIDPKKRASCFPDREEDPRHYLERNHAIVDASDLLIAAPSGYKNLPRGSGTWATIRYAKKKGVEMCIVYPDGSLEKGRQFE